MNLLEQYKGRLSVSESVYSRTHNGEKMDNHKKLVIAKVLKVAETVVGHPVFGRRTDVENPEAFLIVIFEDLVCKKIHSP